MPSRMYIPSMGMFAYSRSLAVLGGLFEVIHQTKSVIKFITHFLFFILWPHHFLEDPQQFMSCINNNWHKNIDTKTKKLKGYFLCQYKNHYLLPKVNRYLWCKTDPPCMFAQHLHCETIFQTVCYRFLKVGFLTELLREKRGSVFCAFCSKSVF